MNSNGTNLQGLWPTTGPSSSAAMSTFGSCGGWWVPTACPSGWAAPSWALPAQPCSKISPRAPRDTRPCPPIPGFSAGPRAPECLGGAGLWGHLGLAVLPAAPCSWPACLGLRCGSARGPHPSEAVLRGSRSELPDQARAYGQARACPRGALPGAPAGPAASRSPWPGAPLPPPAAVGVKRLGREATCVPGSRSGGGGFVQANRVLGKLWGLSVLICKIRSHEAVEMSD